MTAEPMKILLCTANAVHPRRRLQLESELRAIEEALQRSRLRERYSLHMSLAVSFTRVLHELDDHEPSIVHFSGHGDTSGRLVLSDDKDGERPIEPVHISDLLGAIPNPPLLVTFATCYSATLASASTKHAHHAIGFDGPFDDASAPLFSATLYERLASRPELDVPRAFRLAKLACVAQGHQDVELARIFERATTAAPAGTSQQPALALAQGPTHRPLVDELARVFWESERAEVFVLRAGLPPQMMPRFSTPIAFWEKIAMAAESGGIPGGVPALGVAAATIYPSNQVFARYR